MEVIDLYKTRDLKFRMSNFKRLPIELETGIWGVTGYPILKYGENIGSEKSTELFERRELLRKEKPYDDPESHIFSHRGNVIYPDGPLNILLDFLSNQNSENLYLLPENPDYNNLLSKLVQGALHSGLDEILDSAGYLKENNKIELDEKLKDFIEANKDEIQEKISHNVFKVKNTFSAALAGINISDKFDIAYALDPRIPVYISYNDDHMNQAVIVESKIDPKDIVGIILNASKIENYKNEKYQFPEKPFDYLANIHLGTLRAFIDWFEIKYPNNPLFQKLSDFIQDVPESFFYLDSRSTLGHLLTVEDLRFLNSVAKEFNIEHFPFPEGTSMYQCLLQFCDKYKKPLYSSDNQLLHKSG